MAQTALLIPDGNDKLPNTRDITPENGESWRATLTKIEANFTDLYTQLAVVQAMPADWRTYEEVTTGADPIAVDLTVYQTKVTTGGTQAAEDLTIGDGTGAVIGQRKLVTLVTLTDAGDSVTLDDANISQGADTITAVALTAEGNFILLEWRGATWEVIAASNGVVTTA